MQNLWPVSKPPAKRKCHVQEKTEVYEARKYQKIIYSTSTQQLFQRFLSLLSHMKISTSCSAQKLKFQRIEPAITTVGDFIKKEKRGKKTK